MARAALKWTDVNVTAFSEQMAPKYQAMLDAKKAFEEAMIASMRQRGLITAGQTALFTYRRGLAYAVVAEREERGEAVTF